MSENKLRKVFVGGLGWETEKETLREHFSQFGDIVEAVIISDKFSGRSKGYGFITFTNSTSAIKACQNPTPFINGRRVNCNLAFLRSRRLPSSSFPPPPPPPPPLQGGGRKVVAKGTSWYCYATGPYNHFTAGGMTAFYVAAAGAAPAYGYSPSCISNYGYPQGQYSCQGTVLAPNTILHMYPVYHFQHHQPQVVGIPAQFFSSAPAPATASICGFTTTFPVIISDPLAVSPTNVEAVKGCS